MRSYSAGESGGGVDEDPFFSSMLTTELAGALWWLNEWNNCSDIVMRYSTLSGREVEEEDI